MMYAAKCYWPEVTEGELQRVAARAGRNAGAATFVGSLLFPNDELVLCFFEAPSHVAVKRASERAGIPCERVMALAWVEPPGQERSAPPWADSTSR